MSDNLWILCVFSFLPLHTQISHSYRINTLNPDKLNTFKNKSNIFSLFSTTIDKNGSPNNCRINTNSKSTEEHDKYNLLDDDRFVKLRFAPSPTGLLHIGSLRTYIYNYIFGRKYDGKLILRIDDTDKSRYDFWSLNDIISSLNWLGLDWNEGVGKEDEKSYFQSNRNEIYKKYAQRLVYHSKAYYCFCKPNFFATFLKKLFKSKKNKCDKCLSLTKEEIQKKMYNNEQFSILLKSNNVNDDDMVIIRRNGASTYNFSSCLDDMLMNVTHIIRGSEHLSNLPKQELIFRLFNHKLPKFIHLPLIHNEQHTKLSKRNNESISTENIHSRLNGICKLALTNYLTFLGTKKTNNNEVYELNEVVRRFSFDSLNKLPVIFDYNKLLYLNKKYLTSIATVGELKPQLEEYVSFFEEIRELNSNGNPDKVPLAPEYLELKDVLDKKFVVDSLIEIYKPRLSTLKDYFVNIKKCLDYVEPSNNSNVESIKKDLKFRKWFKYEMEMLFKLGVSTDLHTKFEKILEGVMEFDDKSNYLRNLRQLLTGYDSGPSLVDLVKTFKVIEELELVEFSPLLIRLEKAVAVL